MRTIVVVALALLGMALTDTSADAGAWCANYRRGVSNCGYSSYAQCFATVQGLAGYCAPNPFPGTAYGSSAGSWIVPRHPGAIGGTIRKGAHCRLQIRFSVAETSGCERSLLS